MEVLTLSKHVEVVPRLHDYAVYNKLFGNLCFIDGDGLSFLQSFSEPRDVSVESHQMMTQRMLKYVDDLKDRFFLVPQDFDERDIIEEEKRFRSANIETGYLLRGIQLVLINSCNLGCTYCYQDTVEPYQASSGGLQQLPVPNNGMQSMRETASKRKMSPQTAIEIVQMASQAVKRAGNEHLSIEFFGGEPLLNWEAIAAVLDTFGHQTPDGVHLHYSITTNATRITDEIARKFAENAVTVTVSYDSPSNSARVSKEGSNANTLIERGLTTLSKNDVIITFNTVVSVSNVDSIDVSGLLEIARQHKVRQIGVILDLDALPYQNKQQMSKVMDTVMLICKKAPEYGIGITGYWHQVFEQIIGAMPLNLEKGYKTCAAEGAKLSFEPDGSIKTCKIAEASLGEPPTMGDVFKQASYKHHAQKAYETSPYCKGCAIEGFCSGLCIGTILKTNGNIDGIVPAACDVYRELTIRLINAVPKDALERLDFPRE